MTDYVLERWVTLDELFNFQSPSIGGNEGSDRLPVSEQIASFRSPERISIAPSAIEQNKRPGITSKADATERRDTIVATASDCATPTTKNATGSARGGSPRGIRRATVCEDCGELTWIRSRGMCPT